MWLQKWKAPRYRATKKIDFAASLFYMLVETPDDSRFTYKSDHWGKPSWNFCFLLRTWNIRAEGRNWPATLLHNIIVSLSLSSPDVKTWTYLDQFPAFIELGICFICMPFPSALKILLGVSGRSPSVATFSSVLKNVSTVLRSLMLSTLATQLWIPRILQFQFHHWNYLKFPFL